MIISAFITHFIADSIFQREIDAKNKHKSLKHLLYHGLYYFGVTLTGITLYVSILGNYIPDYIFLIWLYSLLVSAIHIVQDFFTSKLSNYFWEKSKHKHFWFIILLDQCLHYITIFYLIKIIFGI